MCKTLQEPFVIFQSNTHPSGLEFRREDKTGLQVVFIPRNNQQIHLKKNKTNKLCFFGLVWSSGFYPLMSYKNALKVFVFWGEPVGTVVSLIHSHYNMLSTQLFLSTPLSHQPCLAWLKQTPVLTRRGSSRHVWWHHSRTPKYVDRDLANEVVLVQLQTLAWFICSVSLIQPPPDPSSWKTFYLELTNIGWASLLMTGTGSWGCCCAFCVIELLLS